MTAHELAEILLIGRNYEIMILDNSNGGGVPRELNFGPCLWRVHPKHAEETADCSGKIGDQVIVIGYDDGRVSVTRVKAITWTCPDCGGVNITGTDELLKCEKSGCRGGGDDELWWDENETHPNDEWVVP